MSKRASDTPQEPTPHPSTRIESGNEDGIDASIGVQAVDDSNIDEDVIGVPNRNEDGVTEEEGTDAVPVAGERNESPADTPPAPTKKGNNDVGSEESDDTTPPATPAFVGQKKGQNKNEDTNNKPPSSTAATDPVDSFETPDNKPPSSNTATNPVDCVTSPDSKPPSSITATDLLDCFDESVYTNVRDIDETSNKIVKIGENVFSAQEWKTGHVRFPSGATGNWLIQKKNAMCQYRSYICELQCQGVSTFGLDAFQKQVLLDLRTNWRLSLYAPNLSKGDVNGIVCDLYYLGQHYHCDDNGTMFPKKSSTPFITKQKSDWDIYDSNYVNWHENFYYDEDHDALDMYCLFAGEEMKRLLDKEEWLNETFMEYMWHW